jgi:hypothetical protein
MDSSVRIILDTNLWISYLISDRFIKIDNYLFRPCSVIGIEPFWSNTPSLISPSPPPIPHFLHLQFGKGGAMVVADEAAKFVDDRVYKN